MKTVNMHEAKTHLSRLVEDATRGESFVIARAGRPLVKVEALAGPAARRTGFLKGEVQLPADFDRMGADAIADLFEGGSAGSTGAGGLDAGGPSKG